MVYCIRVTVGTNLRHLWNNRHPLFEERDLNCLGSLGVGGEEDVFGDVVKIVYIDYLILIIYNIIIIIIITLV